MALPHVPSPTGPHPAKGDRGDCMYCKRGYFRWGKISRKCLQDISRGGNFRDTAHISFIKAYGFNFRVGGNFREEDKSAKKRENYPHSKISTFTVYACLPCVVRISNGRYSATSLASVPTVTHLQPSPIRLYLDVEYSAHMRSESSTPRGVELGSPD